MALAPHSVRDVSSDARRTGPVRPCREKVLPAWPWSPPCGVRPGTTSSPQALEALRNLEHRGAAGSDAEPAMAPASSRRFRMRSCGRVRVRAAPVGRYAWDRCSFRRRGRTLDGQAGIDVIAARRACRVLGWREVPTRPEIWLHWPDRRPGLRAGVRREPRADGRRDHLSDRPSFRLRKRVEPSRQCLLLLALLSHPRLQGHGHHAPARAFYPDLADERFASRSPSCTRGTRRTRSRRGPRATVPADAHNGEINTVQGNRNWMRARQSQLHSDLIGDIGPLLPILTEGAQARGMAVWEGLAGACSPGGGARGHVAGSDRKLRLRRNYVSRTARSGDASGETILSNA